MIQEFDASETNDRLEESCSCDLNSIDNTESDSSPAIVKSHSETLDTPQSCEVVSLDSRLSDKPETPTTARATHTETATILEEANYEAVSLPTTQETSEVISIESSSDLYSEVHKIESSSPDSIDTLKKEENADHKEQSVNKSSSTEQIEETTTIETEDAKKPTEDTNIPDVISTTVDDKADDSPVADEESKDKPVEENNATINASNTLVNTEDSNKTTTLPENIVDSVISKANVDDNVIEADVPITPTETQEVLTVKTVENLQLENDREIVDSDTSEPNLMPTENQENETKSQTSEGENINQETVEKDNSEDNKITVETDEDNTGEIVKNPNCSTSIVESNETGAETVDLENEKAETVVVNSALNSNECAVDSVTEDKSAVINDNDVKINEKHSREPSTISTSVSDNKSDVPATTDEIEVTDSVCNNSDVQSSVDNVTQVPNLKQQIPTISTVCDANKSLPDGVPQIVSSNVAKDNALLNDLSPDHVDPHRRSSLPIVSLETIADDNGHESPSLPVPLRKTSSPQKRPRSASTSTQVDPNHFGAFENLFNLFMKINIIMSIYYVSVSFLSQKPKDRNKVTLQHGRCSVQVRHVLLSEYQSLNGLIYINDCCRTFYSRWKLISKYGEGNIIYYIFIDNI